MADHTALYPRYAEPRLREVPPLAVSLAGRMKIIRLYPLAQCELARHRPRFLDALFSAGFNTGRTPRLAGQLAARIVAGGCPAALARAPGRRRAIRHRDCLDELMQRDVRDLTRIRSLDALPRLLALAAARTAHLLSVTNRRRHGNCVAQRSRTTSPCSSASFCSRCCRPGTTTDRAV